FKRTEAYSSPLTPLFPQHRARGLSRSPSARKNGINRGAFYSDLFLVGLKSDLHGNRRAGVADLRGQRIRLRILLHVRPHLAECRGDVAAHFVDGGKLAREIVDAQDMARLAFREFALLREDDAPFDGHFPRKQTNGGHAVVQRVLRIGKGVAPLLADDGPFDHLIPAEYRAGHVEHIGNEQASLREQQVVNMDVSAIAVRDQYVTKHLVGDARDRVVELFAGTRPAPQQRTPNGERNDGRRRGDGIRPGGNLYRHDPVSRSTYREAAGPFESTAHGVQPSAPL